MSALPSSTYRLQFRSGLGFGQAAELVEYLDELGVTHLYASPLAFAETGSTHGYDIVDPGRLDPTLGTEADFDALVAALRRRGLGLVWDQVPNHLAASPRNPLWSDVLREGRASRWAAAFDVDWEMGNGRLVLPFLGDEPEILVRSGDLRLAADAGGVHVLVHGERYPVPPQALEGLEGERAVAAFSAPHRLLALLDRLPYRLVHWRRGPQVTNYRRFFDIDRLVGVRAEHPATLHATHELLLRLLAEAKVDGVRVDHVDGLRDPLAYLRHLADHAPLVLVEKILAADEALPEEWPVAGTTGYEFAAKANGLFVDPAGLRDLTAEYRAWTGDRRSFEEIVHASRRRTLLNTFPGRLDRLSATFAPLAGLPVGRTREALLEVTACLPVYRTYVRGAALSAADRARLEHAFRDARLRAPHLAEDLDRLARCMLEPRDGAWIAAMMDWQQFTPAATAKGVEDTALYVHVPLAELEEVGVDPDEVTTRAAAFHAFAQARRRWPGSLNATSTHDSKRSGDVRARLHVLAERPRAWTEAANRWRFMNAAKRGATAPDAREEWFLYQTLAGAWPLDERDLPSFRERVKDYAVKAAREAKVNTTWTEPNPAHERALRGFIDDLFDDAAFLRDFRGALPPLERGGALNSLAQVALKVGAPGVPDVYQGTETWTFSLVDPDNRRPVDWASRRRLLDSLRPGAGPRGARDLCSDWRSGAVKMGLLRAGLRWRRGNRAWASAEYFPLHAEGPRGRNAFAFLRRIGDAWALVAVPRLVASLVDDALRFPPAFWEGTGIPLPPGAPRRWRSLVTDATFEAGDGSLAAQALFDDFPVTLAVSSRP